MNVLLLVGSLRADSYNRKVADAYVEYNYSVPGALKNAFDWISRVPKQPFAGKPASVIGASMGSIGTARMQYHMRQIGVFLDMQFMTKPEIMVGKVQTLIDESGKLSDGATLEHLRAHFSAFAKFASRTMASARPSDSAPLSTNA